MPNSDRTLRKGECAWCGSAWGHYSHCHKRLELFPATAPLPSNGNGAWGQIEALQGHVQGLGGKLADLKQALAGLLKVWDCMPDSAKQEFVKRQLEKLDGVPD